MAIENDLTVTVQQLDSDATVVTRRTVVFEDITPTVGEFRIGVLTDNAQTTIQLPKSQIRQLYLKNLDTAALYTVDWTPTTGAEKAGLLILGPGESISFWCTNTGATRGISSLKLTSNTNQTQYFEMFAGG